MTVTPAAVSLAPGRVGDLHRAVTGPAGAQPLDDGWVTWRGANGNRVRIPVVLAR